MRPIPACAARNLRRRDDADAQVLRALALFIVGLALEAFGFTKGAEAQNAAALNGIWWVFWWAPACWRSRHVWRISFPLKPAAPSNSD